MTQPLHEVACNKCGRRYSIDPTLVTQNFACPECQGVVDVSQVPSTPVSTPAPAGAAQTDGPSQAVVSSPATSVAQRRAAKRSGPISVLVVGFLFLAAIAGIACFAWYLSKTVDEGGSATRKKGAGTVMKPADDPTIVDRDTVNWAIAGEKSVNFGNFRIRIPMVEYSSIRARDGAGNFQTSGETPYLKVFLELRNNGLPTDYKTWYRELPEGSPEPRLVDEDGNRLLMVVFDNAGTMQGHMPSATVEQNTEIKDVLVFELAENVSIDDVGALYLSLPGSAVGLGGAIHFKIPTEKIQVSGKPTESGLQASPLGG